MTIFKIPTPSSPDDPFSTQRTTLDGVEYAFRFLWNTREGHWYMTLSDSAESPIASSRKIVVDWDLLRGVIDDRKPPGLIVAIDTSEQGIDPGQTELGERVLLTYFDAEEVAALEAAA
jgi:hypothetical protein